MIAAPHSEVSPVILVAGATGFVGGEVCRRLAAAGRPVRALVRPTSEPAAVARLGELGAELVEGDLRDPASLARACRGATAVVSTASATRATQPGETIAATDLDGQLALVDAARAAGVRRFVFVSVSGSIEGNPVSEAKRAVERRLRESGMRHTVLRPTFFMEVWLSPVLGFDAAGRSATIYGSGTNAISWISLGDVAEFAVRGVDADGDEVLELGGPDALAPLEVVRIFEEAAGAPFTVQHVPEEALRAQEAAATDPTSRAFASFMLGYARGDRIPMDDVLRRYPVRLTSVREHALRVARG
jgi:NADH dehydrogenase